MAQVFTYNFPEHITLLKMEQRTQEWLDFKSDKIGGTDIAPILKESQNKSRLRLFLEMTGQLDRYDLSKNEYVFWGNHDEEHIMNMIKYIDIEGNYIEHFNDGVTQRIIDTNPGILLNSKYPWMMGSLDGIEHGGYRQDTLSKIQYKILDAKNTTSMALNTYIDKCPREYVCQQTGYMTLSETEYCELGFKIDGNKLRIFPILFDQDLSDIIIEQTFLFNLVVLKAKKLIIEMNQYARNFDMFSAEQCKMELDNLQPEPDSTEDYEKVLKERYRDLCIKERPATAEEEEYAEHYKIAYAIQQTAKSEIQLLKNTIARSMGKDKLQKLHLQKGAITYGSTVRVNKKDGPRQENAKAITKELITQLKTV